MGKTCLHSLDKLINSHTGFGCLKNMYVKNMNICNINIRMTTLFLFFILLFAIECILNQTVHKGLNHTFRIPYNMYSSLQINTDFCQKIQFTLIFIVNNTMSGGTDTRVLLVYLVVFVGNVEKIIIIISRFLIVLF